MSVEEVEAIRQQMRASAPDECCGALIRKDDAVRALALPNSAEQPSTSYVISARSYLAAEAEAEAGRAKLVGFFHSHPHGSSEPSPIDIATAVGGFFYVIVGASGSLSAWFAPHGGCLERVASS